jgi:hypothetical protein
MTKFHSHRHRANKYLLHFGTPSINSFFFVQGAFVGTLSSLIFTMWMGFGQTYAQYVNAYNSSRWSPKMPTSIENCPDSWLNYTGEECLRLILLSEF